MATANPEPLARALTTMNTCWNWDFKFGMKGLASGSWKTTVTMSLPIYLFLGNC